MNEDAISTVELISIQKDDTTVAGYKRKKNIHEEGKLVQEKRHRRRAPVENVD